MRLEDDITRLRERHPGWRFGTVWATAASGPDARRIWGARDGVQVHAWTAAELSMLIEREEREDDS